MFYDVELPFHCQCSVITQKCKFLRLLVDKMTPAKNSCPGPGHLKRKPPVYPCIFMSFCVIAKAKKMLSKDKNWSDNWTCTFGFKSLKSIKVTQRVYPKMFSDVSMAHDIVVMSPVQLSTACLNQPDRVKFVGWAFKWWPFYSTFWNTKVSFCFLKVASRLLVSQTYRA